ncbi:hypothetical protein PR048_031104 [Dryococelus australis]|uniref:DUF4371 domain-containing protein n=1 Tax=Dryococelus australis TaxID=614101 RepID=A0ABQ9G531_9NEOP|nr:hypothetical protein PR048_031104 [Dryococelus australis]
MAHSILRGLLSEIGNRKEFSTIVDEARDESCKEQAPICIRTVNSQILEAEEVFLGLYETSDITGKRLFAATEDVLCRFNLSFQDLRGQCYDGGNNVSGTVKGVQAIITEKQPKAQYYHCANRSQILAQDCVKNIPLLRDCMQWVKEIGNIVKGEKKNEDGFNHLWSEMDSKIVEYELIFPTLPSSKKTPKKLQQSICAAPDYQFASPEELYRKLNFEALDSITGEIRRRFEQARYKNMLSLKRRLQLSQ